MKTANIKLDYDFAGDTVEIENKMAPFTSGVRIGQVEIGPNSASIHSFRDRLAENFHVGEEGGT